MSAITLGNSWLLGYYFFSIFYYSCYQLVQLRNYMYVAILFPLTGDWTQNELHGDAHCRQLLAPLI